MAQYLGDTVETVERYYARWVKEFRERSRRIVEAADSLENLDTINCCRIWNQLKYKEFKREQVCKPNSVSRWHRDGDHSSSPNITVGIERPTRELGPAAALQPLATP